jgi:G6PDH family F420-dependent oxidoreductase
MVTLGYFLSSEEHSSRELVEAAVLAERAGFRTATISDHFHPWLPEQGQSPFVWSVLGAIARATSKLRVTTAVVCPTIRIHPAIIAQAAATTQQLFSGRFGLGLGSGEALNEHILGDRWPSIEVRLEMLEEAIGIIRRLWTGKTLDHHGRYYTVENARLWTLPEVPPPILLSAFGPRSVALAARACEGYIGAWPAKGLIGRYRDLGGRGPALGELKVCWHRSEAEAARIAHRGWRHEFVPGQGSQDLPTTTHFAQASGIVTEDMVRQRIPCWSGPIWRMWTSS